MKAIRVARDDCRGRGEALAWLAVLGSLGLICVPTFYGLATTHWEAEDAQGPLILGIIVWLVWRQRNVLLDASARGAPLPGMALLVPGLLLYVIGRSQEIPIGEVGALAPILAGVLLAMRGWAALRALWYPLLFLAFLVPLPASFVDALTGSLKQEVSALAEHILYVAGYPVARDGVVLQVGQYQLLVADACSGLNSMISLSALGLLYLHLVRRKSKLHNLVVLASIVPIACAANVIRVVALALVTYYWGNAAGQGYLHEVAGLVLVMAALLLIVSLDRGLARVTQPRDAT
jgi:exosortase B